MIQETSNYLYATQIDELLKRIKELETRFSCNDCDSMYYDEMENCYKCNNNVSDDVTFLHGDAVIREPNIFSCCYYKQKD